MKELDTRVNIIPVIAKSDTMSRPDLLQFKKQVPYFISRTIRITYKFAIFIALI